MRRILVLACGLVLSLVGSTQASAAAADPLVRAREQAAALRVELADTELRTAAAVEAYDEAYGELGRLTHERAVAEQALDGARRRAAQHNVVRTARVRSLYALGGPAALYSTVLDASSPTEALRGVRIARQLLALDARGSADDARADDELEAGSRRQAAAATAQVHESQRVAGLVTEVQVLLEQQRRLVESADADVLRVAQEQADAARRQAEADFANQLAASHRLAATTPDTAGAPSAVVGAALAAAEAQLGKPYAWGATGPDAFDCSGLTGWAYAAAGVHLPRTSRQQYGVGAHPGIGELLPGDLLFWGADPSTIHHVALYLGAGRMIAAPHSGENVQVQDVYATGYLGATRVVD